MKFLNKLLAEYVIASDEDMDFSEEESAAGAGDVKGVEPGDKDYKRMEDLKAKAGNDKVKLMKLAMNMADAIKRGGGESSREKAQRRAAAAKEVFKGELGDTISMIFMRAS